MDQIVKAITECIAWALIADTTPDIVHHEQISICIRIVHRNGSITENLLACKKASGTTAENLYDLITTTLKSKDISFHNVYLHPCVHLYTYWVKCVQGSTNYLPYLIFLSNHICHLKINI